MIKSRHSGFSNKLMNDEVKEEIDKFNRENGFGITIPELEKEKEEYLLKDVYLIEHIKNLEQELVYLNSLKNLNLKIPLEEAVKNYVNQSTFYLHSIIVGEAEYVELNNKKPEENVEWHITKAKQGSKYPIHVKLRQFGYLNEYSLIKEFQNEILGLISEIVEIKKRLTSLNENMGGLSVNYEIVESLNEFNENVYFVIDKNIEKLEKKKIEIAKEISDKSLEKSQIPTKIVDIDKVIEKKKSENIQEKIYKRQKSQWGKILKKYNAKNLITTFENGFIKIEIAFLLHLKFPHFNAYEEDFFKKKILELEEYFESKNDNENKIFLESFNKELFKIHSEYHDKIMQVERLDRDYKNELIKERSTISKLLLFDMEHSAVKDSKLRKLDYKRKELFENARQTQDKKILSLYYGLSNMINSSVDHNSFILMIKCKKKPKVSFNINNLMILV